MEIVINSSYLWVENHHLWNSTKHDRREYTIIDSPQVKQYIISSTKNPWHELPQELLTTKDWGS